MVDTHACHEIDLSAKAYANHVLAGLSHFILAVDKALELVVGNGIDIVPFESHILVLAAALIVSATN